MAPDTAPDTASVPVRDARPVQIFQVSTLYGAATLAAALDAGLFGPARTPAGSSSSRTTPRSRRPRCAWRP